LSPSVWCHLDILRPGHWRQHESLSYREIIAANSVHDTPFLAFKWGFCRHIGIIFHDAK
jgi:hypothetical protein